jgi:catechol 2,3-dioxygenase-like lactoylglutathione lyase family enzyme
MAEINHVTLIVSELETAAKFYEEEFGHSSSSGTASSYIYPSGKTNNLFVGISAFRLTTSIRPLSG